MSASKYKLRPERKDLSTQKEEDFENVDVSAILRSNLEKQEANKVFEVTEKPKGRKKRDYITVMLVGNLLLAIPVMLQPTNIAVMVYSGSGMILLSVGLSWIMWGVMNDY